MPSKKTTRKTNDRPGSSPRSAVSASSSSNLPASQTPTTPRKRKSGRLSPSAAKLNRPNDAADHGHSLLTGGHFPTLQSPKTPTVHVSSQPSWVKLSDQKLLDMRICDLGIDFEQSPMVAFRSQLHAELKQQGVSLRPHCWFSDDWFSPDGIPGIAVPFYMAHRRLMRLERNQMLQVEGGTKQWCMKIMRHEAGHAVDTAYRLHRRKAYKTAFGSYHTPYPETYRPNPRSKDFVFHLEPWYAQSHPAEDFAETFAVWLTPNSDWENQYREWPALEKLHVVDRMMKSVQGTKSKVASRAKSDPFHRIENTLREHYAQRHRFYALDSASVFDDDLKKIFCSSDQPHQSRTAAAFLQRHKNEYCDRIAQWSGEYRHNVGQVVREMIERCRVLRLYLPVEDERLKEDLLLMLTVQSINYLKHRHRVAL